MDSGVLTEEVVSQAVHEHYVHELLQVLPATFLFWDHMITLGSEIRYIWSRPKSRSSYLFLFLRYFGLLSMISVLVLGAYPMDDESCKRFSLYRNVLFVITQTVVFLLLTLRIYAIFSCATRILVLMGCTTVVILSLATYALLRLQNVPYPLPNVCHSGVSSESAHRLIYVWIAAFVYDTILFFLSAYRTFRYYLRTRLDPVVVHVPLLSLMFRDGAIYFGVAALSTLPNILTYHICGPFMRGGLSSFTSCISVTMMCRIMLNLHATPNTGLSTRTGAPGRTFTNNSPMEFTPGAGTTVTATSIVFDSVILDDLDSGSDSDSDRDSDSEYSGESVGGV